MPKIIPCPNCGGRVIFFDQHKSVNHGPDKDVNFLTWSCKRLQERPYCDECPDGKDNGAGIRCDMDGETKDYNARCDLPCWQDIPEDDDEYGTTICHFGPDISDPIEIASKPSAFFDDAEMRWIPKGEMEKLELAFKAALYHYRRQS